jgi:hypothetical protein
MQLAVTVQGSVETAQVGWHSLARAAAQQDLLSTQIHVLCLEEIYQQANFTIAAAVDADGPPMHA